MSDSVDEMLRQGLRFLQRLTQAQYVAAHPAAYGASIGKHYRHIIDHVESVLKGVHSGLIDYDDRQRGTAVESDLEAARERSETLLERWEALSAVDLERSIPVRAKTSTTSERSMMATSTVAREAMYVVIHAVHHYALIGVMCQLENIPTPEGFGLAPSTLDYQRRVAATDAGAHSPTVATA